MELFEQIRREYDYGVGTIKGVARKLGIHRRMVREALGDAVPREQKINRRGKPRIEPAKAFIEAILQGDEKAPRNQATTHSAPDLVAASGTNRVSSHGRNTSA
jgi:hypothetical protein